MCWCLRYTICAYSNCFFASPCSWCSFLKKENRAVRMAMTQWFSIPSRRGYISTLTWSALWIFSQDSADIFQGREKCCSLAHTSKIVTSRSFHDSQMPQIKGQTEGLYLILSIVTTNLKLSRSKHKLFQILLIASRGGDPNPGCR